MYDVSLDSSSRKINLATAIELDSPANFIVTHGENFIVNTGIYLKNRPNNGKRYYEEDKYLLGETLSNCLSAVVLNERFCALSFKGESESGIRIIKLSDKEDQYETLSHHPHNFDEIKCLQAWTNS